MNKEIESSDKDKAMEIDKFWKTWKNDLRPEFRNKTYFCLWMVKRYNIWKKLYTFNSIMYKKTGSIPKIPKVM